VKNPKLQKIDPDNIPSAVIAKAVCALREGELVVIPTETVYGVAAMPSAADAMDRLFEAKGRDGGKPVARFARNLADIEAAGARVNSAARRLAERFWPGPVTLVLPQDGGTCGYRIPDHPVPLALLEACGCVLAVTSANRSGEKDALTAEEALAALGDRVKMVLDSGPSRGQVPSTVIDVTSSKPIILREGAVSQAAVADALQAATSRRILFVCTGNTCRSPMAEYLLRERLGKDSGWVVESCGTATYDGGMPSQNAIDVMKELNIDIRPHRSRMVTAGLVESADLIVTMAEGHQRELLHRFPGAERKMFRLHEFGTARPVPDVMDPVGGPKDVYRKIRDEVDSAIADLIIYLARNFERIAL